MHKFGQWLPYFPLLVFCNFFLLIKASNPSFINPTSKHIGAILIKRSLNLKNSFLKYFNLKVARNLSSFFLSFFKFLSIYFIQKDPKQIEGRQDIFVEIKYLKRNRNLETKKKKWWKWNLVFDECILIWICCFICTHIKIWNWNSY